MEIIKSAFYFLAVLSVLVIVHEWGHFIVAKLCRMRVEDFSLFFGKKLITLGKWHGTEYNIRAIPLGGFVRISGMEPDDISNGEPIFKQRTDSKHKFPKILRGLDEERLETINADNISDRVLAAVEHAISDDSRLTRNGRQELQTLLVSATINEDEQRYIAAMLEAVERPPDPHGYNQKPLWQRAAVIFAGPFMSLFLGYALFSVMGFTTGMPYKESAQNIIAGIVPGKPADRAGLKPADRIVQINNTPITDGEAMVEIIRNSINRPLRIKVLRNDAPITVTVTPEAEEIKVYDKDKEEVVTKTVGLIGIQHKNNVAWKRYTPVEAVQRGTQITVAQVTGTLSTLFSRHVRENVGGVIAIGQQIHSDSKEGVRQVMLTAAALSIGLGIINLFPIPLLDGGHLMMLAWEGIRRRKPSSREVYTWHMIGLSIIGVLFVLVMYNDIVRLLPNK